MNLSYFLVFIFLHVAYGLTANEHGELARKYKYYYASVRPQERHNRVTNANGTFFALNCDLKIVSTKPQHNKIHMEIIFGVTFNDERLVISGLKNRFQMPTKFQPWLPEITTHPSIPVNIVVYLDPLTGIVDALYRYSVELRCSSETWRHPFELFQCEIIISNIGDERILLRDFQDLRSTEEISKVSVNVEAFKEVRIIASYPELWFSSMVANILPSTVIFCVVIFAQCRRRKVHALVTISALVCIIFMQSVRRTESILTLEDLWLCVTFLHIVCILLVDLMIPTYRTRYIDISNGKFISIIPDDVDIVKSLPLVRRLAASHDTPAKHAQVAQQQITVTASGLRKRLSLAIITFCYFIFVLAYFMFALYLIFKERNLLQWYPRF
uniref:Neur_chan_LBD domain-containing protein n=1 Tax=Elaeophora elaphi TaxID=1147741 RepID=A0A0R3S1P9_9BILA